MDLVRVLESQGLIYYTTIYKSHMTLANASTLNEGFRNRSFLYNSSVFRDKAIDGSNGTFDRRPWFMRATAVFISKVL
jgi:hypothetical protein